MTHQAKAPSAGSSKRQGRRLGRIFRGAFATRASFRTSKGSGAPSARRPKLLLGLAAAIALTLILGATLASAAAPTVTTQDATGVAFTTAKVKGEVDSQELPTAWRFQYITQEQFEANEINTAPEFEGATDGPGGTIEAGTGADTISRKLTGLTPNTTYHLRLLAENGDGPNEAVAASTFKTAAVTAPAIENVEATEIAYATATATGEVKAGNADPAFNSPCYFQWIPGPQYDANLGAELDPFEGASGEGCDTEPTGAAPTLVQAHLSGLLPGTEYHLRLVAGNLGGTTMVEGSTFETTVVNPPKASELQVSAITDHSAHFSGVVNSGGSGAGEAAGSYRFQCTPSCPSAEASHEFGAEGFADGADHAVEANATELLPAQTYALQLIARNPQTDAEGEGHEVIEETSFKTDPIAAEVTTEEANDESTTHATLRGLINPHNAETTYYFEYGQTTAYGSKAPAVPASIEEFVPGSASASRPHAVLQRLDGLAPSTVYHYRLVADSEGGEINGDDVQFETTTPPVEGGCGNEARRVEQHSTYLPDCRAYEMVSPPNKLGNDVMGDTGRTRAAVDGNAAVFASLGGFGDALGGGVSVEYMSVRDPGVGTGWAVHSLTPQQNPLSVAWAISDYDPRYEGELSPDLSRGVYRTSSPLTADPAVAKVGNLYLRDDLRSPSGGSYQLQSGCPFCSTPLTQFFIGSNIDRLPRLDGASADFNHVLFESNKMLTADATADGISTVNLYESEAGVVRLVGLVPPPGETSCAGAACQAATNSVAGPGAVNQVYMPRIVSADGSRVFFTMPSNARQQNGALYLREDHQTTVQINASERTDCADHDPCTGAPEPLGSPQPARFWGASADGSRSFFVSNEALTDDASGVASDLYMYDTEAPVGHHLTLLSKNQPGAPGGNGVRGVIGTSDDGHYVYFLADGQYVAGQPYPRPKFFLWHDGTIHYIGDMADPAKDSVFALGFNWGTVLRFAARVTPDGRHLLFTSGTSQGLTGYDHGECAAGAGCEELYFYNAATDRLSCASCAQSGAPGASNAEDNHRIHTSGSGTTWHLNRAVSGDGRYAFFDTAQALVPRDTNGVSDVYAYDSKTAEQHLVSSGTDPSPSYFMDASADGHDVFFLTAQRLLGWDVDGSVDLYDARVGGGLPEPAPAPETCSGDGCQPHIIAPGAASAASAGFHGPGNPPPKHKKRRHHKRRHHRANHHRRASR